MEHECDSTKAELIPGPKKGSSFGKNQQSLWNCKGKVRRADVVELI